MKLIIRYLLIANLLMKEMKHNENPSLVKSKLNYTSRCRARLDIDIDCCVAAGLLRRAGGRHPPRAGRQEGEDHGDGEGEC